MDKTYNHFSANITYNQITTNIMQLSYPAYHISSSKIMNSSPCQAIFDQLEGLITFSSPRSFGHPIRGMAKDGDLPRMSWWIFFQRCWSDRGIITLEWSWLKNQPNLINVTVKFDHFHMGENKQKCLKPPPKFLFLDGWWVFLGFFYFGGHLFWETNFFLNKNKWHRWRLKSWNLGYRHWAKIGCQFSVLLEVSQAQSRSVRDFPIPRGPFYFKIRLKWNDVFLIFPYFSFKNMEVNVARISFSSWWLCSLCRCGIKKNDGPGKDSCKCCIFVGAHFCSP